MGDGLTMRGRGVTLRGVLGPEEFGFLIKDKGLQGWEGLPEGRREAVQHALAHGEFDVPVKLPARVITVDGYVIARTAFDLNRMCHQIRGWGAAGDRFTLSVELQGETLASMVRSVKRDAVDTGDRSGGFYSAEFQVQMIAADPRKYAAVESFTATPSAWVASRGNFPTHPVIEIPDAPSAYTVTSPGGTFAVTGAPSGGTHRIDMSTGRVTRDGVWIPDAGRGPLWAVPDGTQWEHTLSAPGRVLMRHNFV